MDRRQFLTTVAAGILRVKSGTASGQSPLGATVSCGLEWRRGRVVTGIGATCASSTHGASFTPAWSSMVI